jgi:hypothetical protein
MIGIKTIKLATSQCIRLIGKDEMQERFIKLALYQGRAMKTFKGSVAGANS